MSDTCHTLPPIVDRRRRPGGQGEVVTDRHTPPVRSSGIVRGDEEVFGRERPGWGFSERGSTVTTPRRGLLFHLTHIDNLPSVIAHGLRSDTAIRADGLLTVEVGEDRIKKQRRHRTVPIGPGGVGTTEGSTDRASVVKTVHSWNQRKERLFTPHHINTALDHLGGWIGLTAIPLQHEYPYLDPSEPKPSRRLAACSS